jgi:hypothetical protein
LDAKLFATPRHVHLMTGLSILSLNQTVFIRGNSSAHNQFTAVLSRFGPAGTPSRVSYHQGVAQNNHEPAFLLVGNPLMNDAQLSQTADRAKTRQPGLLLMPTQIVLSSYHPGKMRFWLETK